MASENAGSGSIGDKADQYRATATSAAKDAASSAASNAQGYRDAAKETAQNVAGTVRSQAQDLQANAAAIADDLRSRAGEHADEARGIVSSIADEARNKIVDIVEQQKSASADKLANISHAAQSAADDLSKDNPQVARLVRDAATTVDRFAGDLRSRNLSDVVGSLSDFARRQPVAFFAGSVLAGFVLARFLKVEPVYAGDDFGQGAR
jgi:hypothetical protein